MSLKPKQYKQYQNLNFQIKLINLKQNYRNKYYYLYIFIVLSPISKQELKIDRNMIHYFIENDLITFWEEKNYWNIDDAIIDLFSLLNNKISQYLQKWDRSTLIMVIIN